MDRPTGSFLVRPSSQPNCFRASDHQILTNHGFMFLDQVLAHIKVDQHNVIIYYYYYYYCGCHLFETILTNEFFKKKKKNEKKNVEDRLVWFIGCQF